LNVITKAADLLAIASQKGLPEFVRAAGEIKNLESRGDDIIHDVLTRLNQTFITPIDPEDIHGLASHLDDVLDGIEEVSHRFATYKVDPLPPAVAQLVELIRACIRELSAAFLALSKNDALLQHCIEVNRLEEEADKLVRAAVQELYDTEKDLLKLIKLKEIYDLLEQTTDYCEDVANSLQTVLVKNS
jgi:predicted phosphate transport protein (TIGR00153 family)